MKLRPMHVLAVLALAAILVLLWSSTRRTGRSEGLGEPTFAIRFGALVGAVPAGRFNLVAADLKTIREKFPTGFKLAANSAGRPELRVTFVGLATTFETTSAQVNVQYPSGGSFVDYKPIGDVTLFVGTTTENLALYPLTTAPSAAPVAAPSGLVYYKASFYSVNNILKSGSDWAQLRALSGRPLYMQGRGVGTTYVITFNKLNATWQEDTNIHNITITANGVKVADVASAAAAGIQFASTVSFREVSPMGAPVASPASRPAGAPVGAPMAAPVGAPASFVKPTKNCFDYKYYFTDSKLDPSFNNLDNAYMHFDNYGFKEGRPWRDSCTGKLWIGAVEQLAAAPASRPAGAPVGAPMAAPASRPAGAPVGAPMAAPAFRPSPAGAPMAAPAFRPSPAGAPVGAPSTGQYYEVQFYSAKNMLKTLEWEALRAYVRNNPNAQFYMKGYPNEKFHFVFKGEGDTIQGVDVHKIKDGTSTLVTITQNDMGVMSQHENQQTPTIVSFRVAESFSPSTPSDPYAPAPKAAPMSAPAPYVPKAAAPMSAPAPYVPKAAAPMSAPAPYSVPRPAAVPAAVDFDFKTMNLLFRDQDALIKDAAYDKLLEKYGIENWIEFNYGGKTFKMKFLLGRDGTDRARYVELNVETGGKWVKVEKNGIPEVPFTAINISGKNAFQRDPVTQSDNVSGDTFRPENVTITDLDGKVVYDTSTAQKLKLQMICRKPF